MLATRSSTAIKSLLTRPAGYLLPTALASRRFASQGYGDNQGDPKGENPQDQGPNPSADLEHPGPPPVAEGQGTGAGPTKGASNGHNSSVPSSLSSSSTSAASKQGQSSSSGAQPKIHDERAGPIQGGEKQAEVDKHNREFENRRGRR